MYNSYIINFAETNMHQKNIPYLAKKFTIITTRKKFDVLCYDRCPTAALLFRVQTPAVYISSE